LEYLEIPISVKGIGSFAFRGCSSLKEIKIPNGVIEIKRSVFKDCLNLKNIIIPNTIVKIGNEAFMNCSSLKELHLPYNIEEIGDFVFCGCKSLVDLSLSKDNKHFLFDNNILFNEDKSRILLYLRNDNLETYSIPNSVIKVDGFAFEYNKTLEYIEISDNVTETDGCAFSGVKSLKGIEVSSHNQYFSSEDGILFSKDRQVLERIPIGKNITEYNIPEEVIEIGEHALCGCSTLQKINIPKKVRRIKTCAFDNLDNLKELHIQIIDIYKCNIHNNIFARSEIFESSILYVPSGTRWDYRHHPVFGKFKNIEIERRYI
jgi:hypothetical protein